MTKAEDRMAEKELNTKEAAAYLNSLGVKISEGWLNVLRCRGGKYKPRNRTKLKYTRHPFNRTVTYRVADLKKFAKENYND